MTEKLEEILVKDLFNKKKYRHLGRQDQWARATSKGWVFSVIKGHFTRTTVVA